MIDIRQPGWVGCALAFLALCKVGFVSGLCVPCNVLKISWGRVGKVMGVCICAGCFNRVTHNGSWLCEGGVLVFRQPELKLNIFTNVDG